MATLMDGLRLSVRLPVFVLFLLTCVSTIVLLRLADRFRRAPIDRAPWAKIYLIGLCRLLGFRLRRQGAPTTETALLVSNHISWTDIAVLGACVPLRFLAKSEVAEWPVIGWIARDIGTLFIQRSAGRSKEVREQIAAALKQGHRVLVFPEGTTTAGTAVLPFRGRLLGAALETGQPIQAVTLAYRRDGQADAVVPFIGDDSFHWHLLQVLKKPALEVQIIFHPPLLANQNLSPHQAAEHLHRQIAQGLGDGAAVPDSAEPKQALASQARLTGSLSHSLDPKNDSGTLATD